MPIKDLFLQLVCKNLNLFYAVSYDGRTDIRKLTPLLLIKGVFKFVLIEN